MAKGSVKQNEELVDQVDDNDMLEGVMEYSEDINDAERPEPLPRGDYPATILSVERTVGKESGRPYAKVQYQVDASDMPADYVEKYQVERKTLTGRHFFLEDTPQGRYNAKVYCQAIGAPMGNRLNLKDMTGLTCKLTLDHEDDLEGNPRESVRKVSRA